MVKKFVEDSDNIWNKEDSLRYNNRVLIVKENLNWNNNSNDDNY